MRQQIFSIFIFMCFTINADLFEDLDKIIKLASDNQEKICRKSYGPFRKSIHSNKGEICKYRVTASFAWMACKEHPGFIFSPCGIKALRTSQLLGPAHAMSFLRDPKNGFDVRDLRYYCGIIGGILGSSKKEECLSLIKTPCK